MASFLLRQISKRLQIILLGVVLFEVLLLAFVVAGIRNDFNRNFSLLSEKLNNHNQIIGEMDER